MRSLLQVNLLMSAVWMGFVIIPKGLQDGRVGYNLDDTVKAVFGLRKGSDDTDAVWWDIPSASPPPIHAVQPVLDAATQSDARACSFVFCFGRAWPSTFPASFANVEMGWTWTFRAGHGIVTTQKHRTGQEQRTWHTTTLGPLSQRC